MTSPAPRLVDPATGTTLPIDLASVSLALPALLPSTPQERGIEAVNTRTRRPTSAVLDVVCAEIPGAGADRDTVQAQIDAWAAGAVRLRLVVPRLPVIDDLIIGGRSAALAETTTVRWSVTVQEVREVQPQRGAVPFPSATAGVGDEMAAGEEGGEQSGEPVRESLALRGGRLLGGVLGL